MCIDRSCFKEMDERYQQDVILADGTTAMVEGIGSCRITTLSPQGKTSRVTLNDVLFVSKLETNLVSVKKLAAKGAVILFDMSGCRIVKDQKIIALATISNRLYSLKTRMMNVST